ncbi:MAG: HisA/HisF-related TIM barrel protein [Gemmatales bacterium]
MLIAASVLPVLDLMQGQVVHAVAGRRSQYQPLTSKWCEHAHDPLKLTRALHQRFGFIDYYLADLDALEGKESQQLSMARLVEQGCQLWLDAGFQSVKTAQNYLAHGLKRLIVAGETLSSVSMLRQMTETIFADQLVFSLDLSRGKLRSSPGVFPSDEPLEVVDCVIETGFRQFIVLDTADVGVSQGPSTVALCRQIQQRHPGCTIISGGGVRNRADIQTLENAGVERVLVSTWLHQGCP